jgi:hypothetical protein
MASKDLMNHIHTVALIPPAVGITNANTAAVSSIIDTSGYESCTLVLVTGTETDADATFTVSVEHGDVSNLSDTAAPASTDLVGTTALASFTFAGDNVTRKIGYIGSKRYVRLTVTPAANDAGIYYLSGVAVLGHARNKPTSNPPQ